MQHKAKVGLEFHHQKERPYKPTGPAKTVSFKQAQCLNNTEQGAHGARDFVVCCLHAHGKPISICRIQAMYAKELVCSASRQQKKPS